MQDTTTDSNAEIARLTKRIEAIEELGKEITLFHKALTLTEFHALSRDEQIKTCEVNIELEKKYTKYILEEAKRQYNKWKVKQCKKS